MATDAAWSGLWRWTKGVEPGAVKAARTVLNGGREETGSNVTRLAPTQPRSWRRLTRGVGQHEPTLVAVGRRSLGALDSTERRRYRRVTPTSHH